MLMILKEFAGAEGYFTKTEGSFIEVTKFEVFEVPRFFPTGEGNYNWALVEKVNRNTIDIVKEIARYGKVSFRDVGYAGLKDRSARTLQWISSAGEIPKTGDNFFCRVIKKSDQRLRVGNLLGNWFNISLDAENSENLENTLKQMKHVPNFYGNQRFGRKNQIIGELLINGEKNEAIKLMKELRIPLERRYFRLMEDAFTSFLFNKLLSKRLDNKIIEGDLISRYGPAGPLYGRKLKLATGLSGEIEQKMLDEYGLSLKDFPGKGRRRAFFIPLDTLTYKIENEKIKLRFYLPKGCYATAVLREIVKDKLTSSSYV